MLKIKNLDSKALRKIIHKVGHVAVIPLAILLLVILVVITFQYYYSDKIYPNVYVAGINLGGLSKNQAIERLQGNLPISKTIVVTSTSQNFEITLQSIDFTYDLERSVQVALATYRGGDYGSDVINSLRSNLTQTALELKYNFDKEKLDKNLSVIAGQVGQEPEYPSLKIESGKVVVKRGAPGNDMDVAKLKTNILENLAHANYSSIQLPITLNDPSLSQEEAETFRRRGEKLLDKNLTIKFEYQSFSYKNTEIFKLLGPKGWFNEDSLVVFVESIASQVNRDPTNPSFTYEDGTVKEFTPAKDGVRVENQKLSELVKINLQSLEDSEEKTVSVDIPIVLTEPKIKTSEVNNLGIKQLIGRGTSTYFHSIPGRVHNVVLAASKLNRILVAPGETLSFNEVLGDVSQYTGFQQAYIIKDGKTILGDGGGVCQVSTTLFRAAMNAGLPIIERRAHAYRVGYYEQGSPPGLDATVFSPTTDLKIKNDTPGHILIQTYADPKKYSLIFEIYGTSDGRISSVSKPVTSSVTPPPPDLYQDDPTLPSGVIKQIDFKAWGAKVSFNYKVTRDNETIFEKTFVSNYRPWQAIYLRGIGPAQ